MHIVRIRTDQDPRSELAEAELASLESGDVLLGERAVYDSEGRISEEMASLVYGDPWTSDAELERLGLRPTDDDASVELIEEPF